MKHLAFLLLLLLSTSAFAQQYRLIRPERAYLFGHTQLAQARQQFDHAIRFDSSVVQGSDTLRYNYRVVRPSSTTGCAYTYGDTSWLNQYVLERPGNAFVFFNRHQDSIFFHAGQPSWRMMDLGGGLHVQASLSGTTLEMINGVFPDSVRHFSLQVRDNNNSPQAHPLNGRTFKVARDFGLVQAMSFWEFPDTMPGHSPVLLCADSSHVTAADIWDLQPGDSLHVYQWQLNVQQEVKQFQEYVIQSRTLSVGADSLIFQVAMREVRHFDDFVNPVLINQQSVVQTWRIRIAPQDQPWDQLPYACDAVLSAQLAEPASFPALMQGSAYNGRLVKQHQALIHPGIFDFDTLNQCFPGPSSSNFLPLNLFGIDGLGGDYYLDSAALSGNLQLRRPVWYRKGAETWGTRHNFNALSTGIPEALEGISLYPMPIEGEARIRFAQPFQGTIRIIDMSGREVQVLECTGQRELRLHRAQLPVAGIYLCRFETHDGHRGSLRMVVR